LLILKEKAAIWRLFSWPIPGSTPGCELDSVRLLEVNGPESMVNIRLGFNYPLAHAMSLPGGNIGSWK
jgi:hypothetical protein